MKLLYNIGIRIYWLLAHFAMPFSHKAKLFVKGRKGWRKNLREKTKKGSRYIWFHCASLGEFEQGRPVIESVKKMFPEYKIVLSFFSPSGYEIRKNYTGADIVCYIPLDTAKNARDFFYIIQPEKAFFIKYEFWFHFIREATRRNIPLFVVSAIFRKKQLFFKNNFVGKWYLKTLKGLNHFFVQNAESQKLLEEAGIINSTVSGDTRFDRVAAISEAAKEIPVVEKFKNGNQLIIAGSTWQPDEDLLIRFINQSEGIKFIIAPHEVSIANIKRIKETLAKPYILFSEITNIPEKEADVLIIDSIGLLSSLYRYGEIAYIGGGFGVGIHNILEAATFGLPVIFGPNYKKFKEATDLVKLGSAFSVSNYKEMEQILIALLQNSEKLGGLSDLSVNYVKQNKGATKTILKKTFKL